MMMMKVTRRTLGPKSRKVGTLAPQKQQTQDCVTTAKVPVTSRATAPTLSYAPFISTLRPNKYKCRTCGALDDHDTARCPMTQRCFNCSRLGHIAPACPEPQRQSGSFCKSCGSRTHLDRSCPQIWRLYIPSPTFNPDGPWKCEAWCYNCAAKGHYGDECGKARRTRVVDQSAFCIGNQPTTRAERERADREAARTLARQRARNAEEMKDDWFARRQHAHIDSYRPLSSQNGGRGTNGSGGSYGSSGGGMYRGPVVGKGSRYNPYARPEASDSSRSQMKREDRFDRRPPPPLVPSSSFSLRSRDSRNGERERGRERNGNSLAQRFSR